MAEEASKYVTAVRALQDPGLDHKARTAAVRAIKNALIGNKSKKALYLQAGLLGPIVDILQTSPDNALLIQAAATLGSIAHGYSPAVTELMACRGVEALLRSLNNSEAKVVETVCRSLKIIYQSAEAKRDILFEAGATPRLIELLGAGNEVIAEVATTVLARCCDTQEHQDTLSKAGAIRAFIHVLSSLFASCQEAALDGLAAISSDNPALAETVAMSGCTDTVFRMVKDRRPRIRLLAATCIANLNKANALKLRQKEITSQVLPSVVKLLSEPQVREEAPLVMACLVGDSEELQKAACDADSVSKLASFLSNDNVLTPKMRENVLAALAELCALREESRKMVIQAKLVLPAVISALDEDSPGIREAACRCARSLSRSVKNLRTSLVDAGLALPLLRLLNDPSVRVQTTASAALCNIVLDFSPMKKVVIEQGGVARLVALTSSMDQQMRLHAVWALKNLMFMADPSIKDSVMAELTYPGLFQLIQDDDAAIQEQALTLLRNIAVGKEKDIEKLFKAAGPGLLELVSKALDCPNPRVGVQALYVVCNVATGNGTHKSALINHGDIIPKIVKYLDSESAAMRVAAVWCIINLTWPDGVHSQGRVRALREAGCEDRLRGMISDPDLDVRDRVKTVLDQFSRVY